MPDTTTPKQLLVTALHEEGLAPEQAMKVAGTVADRLEDLGVQFINVNDREERPGLFEGGIFEAMRRASAAAEERRDRQHDAVEAAQYWRGAIIALEQLEAGFGHGVVGLPGAIGNRTPFVGEMSFQDAHRTLIRSCSRTAGMPPIGNIHECGWMIELGFELDPAAPPMVAGAPQATGEELALLYAEETRAKYHLLDALRTFANERFEEAKEALDVDTYAEAGAHMARQAMGSTTLN